MIDWKIYILFCDQKTYYVGITSNLEQRIISHKSKQDLATKEFSDLILVYTEKCNNRKAAEKREKQLKRWSFAKKKALVGGDLELLKRLSKNRESC